MVITRIATLLRAFQKQFYFGFSLYIPDQQLNYFSPPLPAFFRRKAAFTGSHVLKELVPFDISLFSGSGIGRSFAHDAV